MGNRDFAIECIERAVQLSPDNPAAHNNLGILLKDLGQFDDVIAAYTRALKLKPDFVPALNNQTVATCGKSLVAIGTVGIPASMRLSKSSSSKGTSRTAAALPLRVM